MKVLWPSRDLLNERIRAETTAFLRLVNPLKSYRAIPRYTNHLHLHPRNLLWADEERLRRLKGGRSSLSTTIGRRWRRNSING
jgi:hypothetical protein